MKTVKILFSFAILVTVATACPKVDPDVISETEINATVSGAATCDDETSENFNWQNDATVALVSTGKTVQYVINKGIGTTNGVFKGEDLQGAARYAASPYNESSTIDADGNFEFDFPRKQKVTAAINGADFVKPNDVKVLVGKMSGSNVSLQNVASFIRIPVVSENGCRIDSVEVATSGISITGKADVQWNEDGTVSATATPEGYSYSRVIFEQPFIAGQEPVYVAVPVLPADLPNGIRVTVYSKINNVVLMEEGFTTEAGKVYTTPSVNCGDNYALLIDGPSFNNIIKEMALKEQKITEPDTSDFFVKCITFNTNDDMKSIGENNADISANGDGSIMCDIDSEGMVNVYTKAASIAVLNSSNMFSRFAGLEDIEGIECLDTYGATAMKHMFSGARSLTKLDLSSFNNANAMAVDSMFWRCYSLEELILGDNFITNKALRAVALFHSCIKLKSVDISKFDVSGCSSIGQMFQNCWSMDTIVCPVDASGCTSISQLFYNCRNTKKIDISKMKTSEKLVNTRYLMYCCNSIEGKLDFSNFYTLKDSSFFYAFAGLGKVDTIYLGENFNINSALKRAETKASPLQYFFGYTASASSTTCYVGAGRLSEEYPTPTVVVCSRLFLQQLMKDKMAGPKIQMKNGKIKYVNYNGNQFTLTTKDGTPIALTDINSSDTSYIVVDPDEKKE